MSAPAERCKETVCPHDRWGASHPHQCSRKAVKDCYCKTHHPDAVKERQEKSYAKYREKIERESPYYAAKNARLATLKEVLTLASRFIGKDLAAESICDVITEMVKKEGGL